MVTLGLFVLDPTENEKQILNEKKIKFIALDSNNPKDDSLTNACKRENGKAAMFIIEKPNYDFGHGFGFGDSEEDFCVYPQSFKQLLLIYDKIFAADVVQAELEEELIFKLTWKEAQQIIDWMDEETEFKISGKISSQLLNYAVGTKVSQASKELRREE